MRRILRLNLLCAAGKKSKRKQTRNSSQALSTYLQYRDIGNEYHQLLGPYISPAVNTMRFFAGDNSKEV